MEGKLSMRKSRVLLVDDDQHILKINNDVLESEGYKITTAVCGKNAIEAIRLNVDDYLLKPYGMYEFIERVSHCLNKGACRKINLLSAA